MAIHCVRVSGRDRNAADINATMGISTCENTTHVTRV
jgi:hypothetical protein